MEINQLLTPERILVNLHASNKKQLLQELSSYASSIVNINERSIFETLLEREALGTTGVGQGIAIPHGKFDSLKQLYGFFVRLETPINFDSIDNQDVDLIFLLLAPETSGADHLKALAKISRLLRNQTICEKIRATEDINSIYGIFIHTPASHAA
ncbi:MAG: PTS IIA-like nitrogen regulatory protein PtsN [Alphaproteobacteria bacterium]|nr:PTS IIA-like nitrogen regulatory protein PtsN [Alphaproteobacteria bacterium]